MVFWLAIGGLAILILLWILWSVFDKATSAQLVYNPSSLNFAILRLCPVLQSPYVFNIY